MAEKIKMKAPEGLRGEASIEGHTYDVPKTGVITVVSETHLRTLERHGFTRHFEESKDIARQIEDMDDKDKLVEFIEERGGDADLSMSIKKLKRLARVAANIEE